MAKNTNERLRRLKTAAEDFGERDFSARIEIEEADELGEVEASFNQMAERLDKRAEKFREIDRVKSDFVSSVSHELRTPLTTIKALTRLLMRGELTDEKRHEYLETISVECDRQIDLVLNLLDLSRIEGGVYRLNYQRVEPLEVIESCIKSELTSAGKENHTLRVETFEEVPPVCADLKALRNFPIIGNFRYMLEKVRPEIMQYFVETDTEGKPINRLYRSVIYQRAKKETSTSPFGTQWGVYRSGYEWIDHSIYAANPADLEQEQRVVVGGEDCLKPYSASRLNISAMSFGSLSKNAVLAMNAGARLGNFAQNTGEGGLSPYHLQPGGDLIWQIGTAYFGCRTENGEFDPELFQKKATLENVKMIEIKLSQGAKPGHGGILPAIKNTEEIAAIRHIKPHTTVNSPPAHTAFISAEGLMHFIKQLRDLSGGKPVGFKICIGKKAEFTEICEAMITTGIKPDYIAIDGGEGGTGAYPIEFADSIGMPLRDGLSFAVDTLNGYDLKRHIKVVAAGKVFNGFHIARLIAIGADMVNCARAMMLATGCIQALQCHLNTCPTGVATQDEGLMRGLVVEDKAQRVFNYHQATIESFIELLAASGVVSADDLSREHINRRIGATQVLKYSDIYPEVEVGKYLKQTQAKLQQQAV